MLDNPEALISPEYLALQRELHSRGNYGVSAYKWAKAVDTFARGLPARSVLDYGCGQGMLANTIQAMGPAPYEILEYDPAIPGKEEKPAGVDVVFCGDVLEHIEPDLLDNVLNDIQRIARKAVFLVIATRPAKKVLADGRNAHLIVKPIDWWLPKLQDRWIWGRTGDRGGELYFLGCSYG